MKKIKSLAVIVLMIITIMILSTKAEATTGKINSETVRVRKEATTKSSILIQLDKDKEVEILEESEGWYKISVTVNGEKITGYINSELVDVKGETTEKPVEEPQDNNQTNNNETPVDNNQLQTPNETQNENNEQTSNVTTSIEENKEYTLGKSISVRILPLMNSREIGTINDGNVKTLEIVNDWCKIENDEMTGWVRINNLKKSTKSADIVEPTTPQPVPDEQTNTEETIPTNNDKVIKTGYVSTDSLKVRKEANTSSEIIDSLKKNDKISILEEQDGWYKIKIDGKIGYVSAKYISDKKVAETTSRNLSTPRTSEEEKTTTTNQEEKTAPVSTGTAKGTEVVEFAKQYLGYKYVSGGASPSTGFDCSGFTAYVYKNFGVSLNRTSKDQIKNGVAVERANLQLGDIVIFNGESNKTIGHVGIYIGGGNFIHASNPKGGVKITALSSSYYNVRYVGARRVI